MLREAAASEAADEATRPTRAQERDIMHAGEALAAEKGVHQKTGKVVKSLMNKGDTFVAAHTATSTASTQRRMGYGPSTPEFARKFSTFGCFNRDSTNVRGHTGMGDSWGELQVPYLVPKSRRVRTSSPRSDTPSGRQLCIRYYMAMWTLILILWNALHHASFRARVSFIRARLLYPRARAPPRLCVCVPTPGLARCRAAAGPCRSFVVYISVTSVISVTSTYD